MCSAVPSPNLLLCCVVIPPLQVRAVARRAAALREAEKQLAAAEAGKTLKEGQLTAAKEAQVCLVWRCWRLHALCVLAV